MIDQLDRVGKRCLVAGDIRPRPINLLQRRQQSLRAKCQRAEDRQRRRPPPGRGKPEASTEISTMPTASMEKRGLCAMNTLLPCARRTRVGLLTLLAKYRLRTVEQHVTDAAQAFLQGLQHLRLRVGLTAAVVIQAPP